MIKKLTKDLLDWMYAEHLEYFENCCGYEKNEYTKYAFLSSNVFDLCPYDSDKDTEWGKVIYEVLCAIRDEKNNYYLLLDDAHYNNFLLVCQLLYRKRWINWGTSIRSCWLEENEKSDRVLLPMLLVPIADTRYDEEGIAYSVENLETLLKWMEE